MRTLFLIPQVLPPTTLETHWWIALIPALIVIAGLVYWIKTLLTKELPDNDIFPTLKDEKKAQPQDAGICKNDTEQQTLSTWEVQTPHFSNDVHEEIMERAQELMEKEKPFLDHRFCLSDLASLLGVKRHILSATINKKMSCSFTMFVAEWRVEHAKRMLQDNPESKLSSVWSESGFSNETSFHRTFKAFTGMTPCDWKAATEQMKG